MSETRQWVERFEALRDDLATGDLYHVHKWVQNDGALTEIAEGIARLTRELEEARRKTVEAKEVLHDIADHECSYQVGGAEACPSVPRPRYGVGGRARMCGPCLAEAFFATPPAEGGGDAD